MGLVQELKEKVNGLVVEFQNKVAEALEAHEAATSEPAGEDTVAPTEEQVPDAPAPDALGNEFKQDQQDKANEPTQIPVTDGSENPDSPAVAVDPQPETVATDGPAPTTEGDPNIVL